MDAISPTMPATLSIIDTLADLPPEWPEDRLAEIQARIKAAGRKIVVLDDDPTGTQTVHGVPVLTTWSVEALVRELESSTRAFYILTNSRSLTASAAAKLAGEIGENLENARVRTGCQIDVISRSDSTLRGHFPGEVDALSAALGMREAACLLIPFFLEGGRYTIANVHYVAENDRLIPAAQTPYARDAVFGYRHSNLCRWIEEKTRGRVPAGEVATITMDELRSLGPNQVARKLAAVPAGGYGIVNAAAYRDLEVLVAGLLETEARGKRFVCRTAASFVRVRAGIAPRDTIAGDELTIRTDHGGLFVVGSYVPKTTAQLHKLLGDTDCAAVAVSVAKLIDGGRRQDEIDRVVTATAERLRDGRDTALFTSRELVTAASDRENLTIAKRVSDSLIRIVRALPCQPRYLVAKGGITSSDVATRGLGVRRAMVMGQLLPGVPVWQLGEETRYRGMAYIVFPGNVGSDDALAEIQKKLAPKKGERPR